MSKATVRNTVRAAVIMGAALAAPCFYTHRYPEEICRQRLTGVQRAGWEGFSLFDCAGPHMEKRGCVPCGLLHSEEGSQGRISCGLLRVVPWTL